ncbi:MAG TPA: hypothetical protein VMZ50_10845, partial [Phycisphaerae bacterium]|nr:hypothetical protein [Phycisphaerae bacterium]
DETKMGAYSALPLEVKSAVFRQEQQQQRLQSFMRGIGSDLQYVSADPRYAEAAERLKEELSTQDPQSVNFKDVRERVDALRDAAGRDQAVTLRATKVLGDAQTWFQSIVDPASPTSGDIDKYDLAAVNLAVSNIASALERSSDPKMDAITQKELIQLEVAMSKAKIPPAHYSAMEDDIQKRLMTELNQAWQEPDDEEQLDPGMQPPPQDPERARSIQEMQGQGSQVDPGQPGPPVSGPQGFSGLVQGAAQDLAQTQQGGDRAVGEQAGRPLPEARMRSLTMDAGKRFSKGANTTGADIGKWMNANNLSEEQAAQVITRSVENGLVEEYTAEGAKDVGQVTREYKGTRERQQAQRTNQEVTPRQEEILKYLAKLPRELLSPEAREILSRHKEPSGPVTGMPQ